MNIIKRFFLLSFFICGSFGAYSGIGAGTEAGEAPSSSSNDKGGFGGSSEFEMPNSGFGTFNTLAPNLPPPPPVDIPLDGGASLLIASGLALGGRKLYKRIKNTDEEQPVA